MFIHKGTWLKYKRDFSLWGFRVFSSSGMPAPMLHVTNKLKKWRANEYLFAD
jgi:hypothetical protein